MPDSPLLRLRARGPIACFTRPELKVERVSYPVMTPTAARGLLEAVLWKPAIAWRITRILVLKEINFMSFRRNEVNDKIPISSSSVAEHGGSIRPFFIDEERSHTQRNTVALSDVDYVVEARFALTEKAGAEDNVNKFVEMFRRRLAKGQHYHQPYLGCREFVAEVLPADGSPASIPDTRNLGRILLDIEFGAEKNRPFFFAARLENGVLSIPDGQRIGGAL